MKSELMRGQFTSIFWEILLFVISIRGEILRGDLREMYFTLKYPVLHPMSDMVVKVLVLGYTIVLKENFILSEVPRSY